MSALRFWKMTGAGNDFIVLDGRDARSADASALAAALCPRRVSVGADGLVIVHPGGPARVRVEFHNADGSPAAFCGNASRCIARFAVLRGLVSSPLTIAFGALEVRAELLDGERARIEIARPSIVEESIATSHGTGRRIRAGVDHVVFEDPGAPLSAIVEDLFARRPDLRGDVNVTLLRRAAPGTVRVRTFERGAGETLACGSGALAAGAFLAPSPESPFEITVLPPAEVPLLVRLGERATLEGEARLVYVGEIP